MSARALVTPDEGGKAWAIGIPMNRQAGGAQILVWDVICR
jgi:hypothetical protein